MTTPNTTVSLNEDIFDGRDLPCETKRPGFLSRCAALPVGRSFVFINGHDPVPLRRLLDQRFPGCFHWDLAAGAAGDTIQLRVTKLAAPAEGFGELAAEISCS